MHTVKQMATGAGAETPARLDRVVPVRPRRAGLCARREHRVREPALRRGAEPRRAAGRATARQAAAAATTERLRSERMARSTSRRCTFFAFRRSLTRRARSTGRSYSHFRSQQGNDAVDALAERHPSCGPRGSSARYRSMSACVQSPCVWQRQGAYSSWWYGEVRLSLWPITSPSEMLVPAHQPDGQRERRLQLPRVVEDRGVARADVLDPDRRPVQPDRVPAADAERHELVDRAVRVDHEVRARAREARAAPGRDGRPRTCSRWRRSCRSR